ncbi:MAG: RluA family pseudouridine synthase [Bacteroides sp.]|nr:RluA family pseudouridine synthase [Bacteroides sp.]MCM1379639.1 RluA family pseudouridine synthase [Bacteroides sp.]MCM1445979.1 RluA family pseudouridine synthase [Prevotella sp.]
MNTTDRIATLTVCEENQNLLSAISGLLPDFKRTRLKQMLAHRQVRVNGNVTTQATLTPQPGDKVEVNLTREFREFTHRRLHIVYEDDDIIVVHKGYGLLSMADDTDRKQETAYSILRDYLKNEHPGNKLFIVHRLDRDTSGLMLFAKTVEAKEILQFNWNNMVLERKYLCVVEGTPDPTDGEVRSFLQENSKHEVYSLPDDSQGGKLAITRYRTLASRGRYSLVECELDTGRKNQIRVHMKLLGTPISGDKRYGGHPSPARRMCLHARTIRFVHPRTHRALSFTTPIPAALKALV